MTEEHSGTGSTLSTDSMLSDSPSSPSSSSTSFSNVPMSKTLVLKFLNVFLVGNGLAPIPEIESFQVPKSTLMSESNVALYSSDQIEELSSTFDKFRVIHEKSCRNSSYMIAVIGCLIRAIDSARDSYTFNVKDVCTITHTVQKPKIYDICNCLYNKELRRKVREVDETCKCACGLFQYKNKPDITHTSYGDIKGNFEFVDPTILYRFILENNGKFGYIFVEKRTEFTQGFFDLDFKLEKHGLKDYLPEDKIPELTAHILRRICETMGDDKYVYADKTTGYGVHLYFPNSIISKKELIDRTGRIMQTLITDNIYGWDASLVSKIYKFILDKMACNNGLCLMYQDKNGAHYKINRELSTYEPIPDDKIEQLKLCALRT